MKMIYNLISTIKLNLYSFNYVHYKAQIYMHVYYINVVHKPKPYSFSSVDSFKTSDLWFSNANLSLFTPSSLPLLI